MSSLTLAGPRNSDGGYELAELAQPRASLVELSFPPFLQRKCSLDVRVLRCL